MAEHIISILQPSFHMGLDVLLAAIPVILSFLLFRLWTKPSLLWLMTLAVFVLFLPNAAYTSTDILHFFAALRNSALRPADVAFLVVPEYCSYIYFGMQCHTVSLMNVGHYLKIRGSSGLVVVCIELLVNLLCAFGIYLGRFQRAYSWYVVTKPQALKIDVQDDLTQGSAILLIASIFLVITLLYYLLKLQNLAFMKLLGRKSMPVTPDSRRSAD